MVIVAPQHTWKDKEYVPHCDCLLMHMFNGEVQAWFLVRTLM